MPRRGPATTPRGRRRAKPLVAALAAWAVFGSAAPRAGAAGANLLLVTIDTLRPDRLSCYSPKFVRTPAIDAVAAKGVLFERAFAHTPSTLPSHADILLGLTPFTHGVHENSKAVVPAGFLSLAEHLKRKGFATGAFVGAFPLDLRFGLNRGFDVYDDAFPKSDRVKSPERKAEQVVAPAMAWLDKQAGAWFCWVHLWDPHAPYAPPEPYLSRFKTDPYSGEAAYVDATLDKLFAFLKTKGWAETTFVVLTADHGEALGQHGELTHSYFAYNSTLHVPLVVAGPGVVAARTAAYVSHIDIFPTVCELLEVAKPPSLSGQSLGPLLKGKKGTFAARPIYIESLEPYLNKGCAPVRGFIDGEKKFLDSPLPELYDLARDFDETRDLGPATDLNPYRKKLLDLEKSFPPPPAAGNAVVDREALEKLRTLGYVASPVAQVKEKYGPDDDLKRFLPFQQKLDMAILLEDQGKLDESARLLTEIVGQKPTCGPAYTYLAQLYLSQGRLREGFRTLEDGCRQNPKNFNLFSAYGSALVQHGQWERALDILKAALALADFDPAVWVNLGVVYTNKEDLANAAAAFDKAIALHPAAAAAYFYRGSAYVTLSKAPADLARAVQDFQKVIALDPTSVIAYHGLGDACQAANDLDGAVAAWEKAVAIDPKDDFAVYNLGLAAFNKGDKARARRYFERFLEIKKDTITPEDRAQVLALIAKCK
jgi:arylsulfatase A-like enzyme/Flp pilus assembly protein TadD